MLLSNLKVLKNYKIQIHMESVKEREFEKIPVKSSLIHFKPIREEFTCIFILILLYFSYDFALNHQLPPAKMFLVFLLYAGVMKFTHFNEKVVYPALYFHRGVESVIIFVTPIATVVYFVTFLLDGMGSTAIFNAEICVLFTIFMLLWVALSAITLVGIYFTVRIFWYWSMFLTRIYVSNIPLAIYIEVFMLFLMALGIWMSYYFFLSGAIRKKDHFVGKEEEYQRFAYTLLIGGLLLGIFMIIMEPKVHILLMVIK